jgi:4-carboxymuconolactone decarboxylase
MGDDVVEKTRKTAALYFKDIQGERPFDLWRAFDKDLAKAFSLFITGRMYSRERIPHTTRQLVTVAALTALGQPDELKLHIHAALNVGCQPHEIAEAIFQTAVYAGVPAMNTGLKTLRCALEEKQMWPLDGDG